MPSLKGIGESLIANALWVVVPVAAVFVASRLDERVDLWVLPLAIAASVAIGVLMGRRASRSLAGYQADLVAEAIFTLQEILAGKLASISFEDFIERGILAPARFGLIGVPGEDVRLSVLVPSSDSEFSMEFESGHTVGRKDNFSLPLSGTLAGYAMQSRRLEWTNNVDRDKRWTEHPEAKPNRSYGSLAVMPILVGDECIGVLSVLSRGKRAFRRGDLTYIELLGTLIGLCWTMRPVPPDGGSRLPRTPSPDPEGETQT